MPLETIAFRLEIDTHTDSLPLDGVRLARYLAVAIADYRKENHEPVEIVEFKRIVDTSSEPEASFHDKE